MKQRILLSLLAAIIFASCSTAYKTGQTPDDVYFVQPAKVADEAVAKKEDKKEEDKYEDYTSSQEDRYLRMKVRNRYRWSSIDDYDYWNDTRYYGYNDYVYASNWYYWNNWNSPYYTGYSHSCCCYSNSIYNPYNTVYIVQTPPVKTPVVRPNLNAYQNNTYNNSNQGLGGSIKKVFSNPNGGKYNNSNNEGYQSSNRTYAPSSSSSSSGSSSSGRSSGSVSRPGRH